MFFLFTVFICLTYVLYLTAAIYGVINLKQEQYPDRVSFQLLTRNFFQDFDVFFSTKPSFVQVCYQFQQLLQLQRVGSYSIIFLVCSGNATLCGLQQSHRDGLMDQDATLLFRNKRSQVRERSPFNFLTLWFQLTTTNLYKRCGPCSEML